MSALTPLGSPKSPSPASLMPLARLIAKGLLDWQETFLTLCQAVNAAETEPHAAADAIDRWDSWLSEAIARAEAELMVVETIRPLVARQAPAVVVLAAAEAVNRHAGGQLPKRALHSLVTDVVRQARLQQVARAA